MRDKLKSLLFIFVCVTTGIVIADVVFILIFGDITQSQNGQAMLQVLLVAFLTSVVSLIYPSKEVSKRTGLILRIVHFVLVCAIVLTVGVEAEWYDTANIWMIVGMVAMVAVIFTAVYYASEVRNKHLAERMNERLEQFRDEDDE